MIEYSFSFDKSNFSRDVLKSFLGELILIDAYKMRIGAKSYKFNLKKLFDYMNSESAFSIYDEARIEQIHFGSFGASKCFELIFVLKGNSLSESNIDLIINQEGFTMGYVYDNDFVTWQQATSIQYYEMRKKEHFHLNKIKDTTGDTIIDVSEHYGRKEFYFNTRLMVAPIMYISSKYKKEFPFEKLLNYDEAYHVELLKNGKIIKIVLFSNPLDSEKKYNLIKNFWFFFNYDGLIKAFNDKFI